MAANENRWKAGIASGLAERHRTSEDARRSFSKTMPFDHAHLSCPLIMPIDGCAKLGRHWLKIIALGCLLI